MQGETLLTHRYAVRFTVDGSTTARRREVVEIR
jgi:hypothetical protein